MAFSIDDLMNKPTFEEQNPNDFSPEDRAGKPLKKQRLMRGVPWNLAGTVLGAALSGLSLNKLYYSFYNRDTSYLWVIPLVIGLGGAVAAGYDWYKKYYEIRREEHEVPQLWE